MDFQNLQGSTIYLEAWSHCFERRKLCATGMCDNYFSLNSFRNRRPQIWKSL